MRAWMIAGLLPILGAVDGRAQNWTVGMPVDHVYLEGAFTATNCYPDPDMNFSAPASTVDGVEHLAIVTAATPPGSITCVPGPLDPLDVGDTILIDVSVPRALYFPTGVGNLMLQFHAAGTPTTAGQLHPCGFSDLWISNLLFCPEGLFASYPNICTVQPGITAIGSLANAAPGIILPSALNGWRLSVDGASLRSVELFGSTGQRTAGSLGPHALLDLSPLPDGIYLVQAIASDGCVVVRRFALVH